MSHATLLILKVASSKQGRKFIGGIIALILGLFLLFCVVTAALISSFAVLPKPIFKTRLKAARTAGPL